MTAESDQRRDGAAATFDYDRMTIERFRAAFPRARWDDERKAWWVPGKTADRRISRWRALEAARADVHADAKGRDAYAFEPIDSRYLKAGLDLVVSTPYSRTVVEELRQVPFARWDEEHKVWRIPYRSYDALRRRWPTIEAAARRNEPEERRRRLAEAKESEEFTAARQRAAERRKHRYPVPIDDPPPLSRPVATFYGIVAFTGTSGELAETETLERFYPHIARGSDLVWASWQTPSLEELVKTWPARAEPDAEERARGWWQPTKPELVEARKAAKAMERRRNSRR